jgi:two-component system chemotaxis response regulator CheY
VEPGEILVVDDDDAIRETIAEVLELENFVVKVARNGREGLTLIRGGLRPCLILLDLMMPVMNGWDFARELAGDPALADIPICVLTATGPTEPAPSDVVATIRKPVRLDRLLEVVRQHC